MLTPEEISNYHRELAYLSHKKRPRNKEFYQDMQRKSVVTRKKNKQNNVTVSKNSGTTA